jgi:cysteinyl-tRNA synthetase
MRLYNTLGRQLQDFVPLRTDKMVGLYTCGPTVYAEAHLGNLRSYIFEDVLKRVLLANGFTVKHVMNITDVGHLTSDEDEGEDKIEKAAAAQHLDAWQLAQHFTDIFKQDLSSLNILSPNEWIKATDCIPAQIALVQELETKGFTYKTSDGIYFDTSKLKDYGVLEPQRLAGQRPGERVVMGEKKNPTDFAVWKLSPAGSKRQMEWDSPWGKGFPGWHLECSAISQTAFAGFNPDDKGAIFDIHCGGIDHIAVHHTNEIAQTEAATGRMLAKYWLHGAFLVLGGEQRMGKSEGNALTLRTLQDKLIDPLAYRYFCLQAHYRSPLTFSWEAVEAAQYGLDSLRAKVAALSDGVVNEAAYAKFTEVLNDDLNTAKALAVLQDYLSGVANKYTIAKMDEVLGLNLLDYKIAEAPAEVISLANQRQVARQAKDFAKADELRKQIEAAGWVVDDTTNGFKLRPR